MVRAGGTRRWVARALLRLLEGLHKPVVTVLHTVVENPEDPELVLQHHDLRA